VLSLRNIQTALAPFADNLRVVVGSEAGVVVYDQVAAALGEVNNDPRFSILRRDKELMAEAVSPYVRTIPGKGFKASRAALDWINENNLDFPLFVKPSGSSGSFGGLVVKSAGELRKAFRDLIGHRDPMGRPVERLLVQPYVNRPGLQEYVVDVVVDPEIGVVPTDFFRYGKREAHGHIVYEKTQLFRFNPDDSLHRRLLSAAEGVVKGLKLVEGPLHLEFFVDGDEIIFIEAGARPAGGGMPQFVRACGGNDQITMQLLAKFDRPQFLRLAGQGAILETEGLMIELLGPPRSGVITELPDDNELRSLIPGFVNSDWHVKAGSRVGPAIDLYTAPGNINVKGTPAELSAAYEIVRRLEAGSLYRTRGLRWHERLWSWGSGFL